MRDFYYLKFGILEKRLYICSAFHLIHGAKIGKNATYSKSFAEKNTTIKIT